MEKQVFHNLEMVCVSTRLSFNPPEFLDMRRNHKRNLKRKHGQQLELLSRIFCYSSKLEFIGLLMDTGYRKDCQVSVCLGDDQLLCDEILNGNFQINIERGLNDQENVWIYGHFIVGNKSFCMLTADWWKNPKCAVICMLFPG